MSSVKLIVGAFFGKNAQTLEEFHARDAYYGAKGALAVKLGLGRGAFNPENYAPSDETIMMCQRGYDRAEREAIDAARSPQPSTRAGT